MTLSFWICFRKQKNKANLFLFHFVSHHGKKRMQMGHFCSCRVPWRRMIFPWTATGTSPGPWWSVPQYPPAVHTTQIRIGQGLSIVYSGIPIVYNFLVQQKIEVQFREKIFLSCCAGNNYLQFKSLIWDKSHCC